MEIHWGRRTWSSSFTLLFEQKKINVFLEIGSFSLSCLQFFKPWGHNCFISPLVFFYRTWQSMSCGNTFDAQMWQNSDYQFWSFFPFDKIFWNFYLDTWCIPYLIFNFPSGFNITIDNCLSPPSILLSCYL